MIPRQSISTLFPYTTLFRSECGLTKRRARQILAPLLTSTAANLGAQTPAEALTGPFARGDVATVRTHLAAMKAKKMTDRKSTRLNSSHSQISYAVFCLKKKK